MPHPWHHASLFIYLLFVCTIDGRQCGRVQGETEMWGRGGKLFGWGGDFFFLKQKAEII